MEQPEAFESSIRQQKRNYESDMQTELHRLAGQGEKPRLLLHCCCAPCASAALERLEDAFAVTLYYDNPNMDTAEEYEKRAEDLRRLALEWPRPHPCVTAPYQPAAFLEAVRGLENEPEGGARCAACFRLRLHRCARYAAAEGFGYFASTLTVGPRKDAGAISLIGSRAGALEGVAFLPSDFKKRGGFLRSVALSREYGLYRQDYCGCAFSRRPGIGASGG